MNNSFVQPVVLTILDGWGHSNNPEGNAIKKAKTPTVDYLLQKYPNTLLNASGEHVGLPDEQMGNSEVGHITIGAGRIINQDLVRINKEIKKESFSSNIVINNMCQEMSYLNNKLHIIGLCSDGGVHSHINHLIRLIKILINKHSNICLHIITDGRDTEAYSAKTYIKLISKTIEKYNNVNICTFSGRYYSMDRDCRWTRTEKAYKVLIENSLDKNKLGILDIIDNYYKEGISDEFIPPTRIKQGCIENKDGIIFFNFRPDRIRQLLHAFTKNDFKGFSTKLLSNLYIATFTQYDSSLDIPIIFPNKSKSQFLGEVIAKNHLKQFRLAETEKYPHVTYFFNGGIEEPFPGEYRELIPSPKVDTYDLKPEMSARKVTERAIHAIRSNNYELIVLNYANPDMVGHTGDMNATIKAIETIDECINKLLDHIEKYNTTLIITADHGNAEFMLTTEKKPCKSHSTNLVPFILIEPNSTNTRTLRRNGSLADIAPTILDIMNIKPPTMMSGKSLLKTR